MITRVTLFIFFAAFFISCSNPRPKNNKQTATPEHKTLQRTYIPKPPSSFEDTLIIKVPASVFFKPDTTQLEKIKTVNKPMVFEGLMHDCFFQMRNAHIVLKKYYPKITILETNKARYLLFVKKDNSKTCMDLNQINDICGMYIFDTKKNPQLVDMTNVDTELGFYFRK